MEYNYNYSSDPYYQNYGAPNVSHDPGSIDAYPTQHQPSYNAVNTTNVSNYDFPYVSNEYPNSHNQVKPEEPYLVPSNIECNNPVSVNPVVPHKEPSSRDTVKTENVSSDLISFGAYEEYNRSQVPNTDVTSLTEDLLNASLNTNQDDSKGSKPTTSKDKQRSMKQSNISERVKQKARQQLNTRKPTAVTRADLSQQPDPFAQWYQMMSQYYNQFYPGYQLPQPPNSNTTMNTSGAAPNIKSTSQPPKQKRTTIPPANVTPYSQQNVPMTAALNSNSAGNFDYASYYYQYYYGAAAAAQMWSGNHPFFMFNQAGRQTPRFYHTPHLKAWLNCPGFLLQILPTRPVDGELARIEILDLTEVANEAVAEATRRSSEIAIAKPTHLDEHNYAQENLLDAHHSVTSGIESPSHLSSLRADTVGDDEIRACNVIVSAWDQTDHMLYPGPLNRQSTLKADVLAFLKDKLSEIQDRLPIDWESAGLLISFLEILVKNNGTIQSNDLVNLLLEGQGVQTRDLMSYSMYSNYGGSHYRIQAPVQYVNMMQSNNPYFDDSMASLPASGRQSPHSQIGLDDIRGHTRAASEAGGRAGSVRSLIRRSNMVTANRKHSSDNSEHDRKVLDRFRELLMHAMPVKALDYACQFNLWGHAFALAHRMGPSVFSRVMDRFLGRALPTSDPILTYYQLTANEIPHAVNTAAYGRGADIGAWRPHLAMILAAESSQPELARESLQRLGDSLLSRKLVYAAHLCYLLMGPIAYTSENEQHEKYKLPDKIWLIGALPSGFNENTESVSFADEYSPFSASSEAIQLTEVYEYAVQLSNRNYRLPQLLPYRLAYTIRLMDAGLFEKAFRYLTLIGQEILLEADRMGYLSQGCELVDPNLYSLVSNCLRFAEPLQNHPGVDNFDFGGTGNLGIMSTRMRLSHDGTGDWIGRLRDLYRQMNHMLGHSFSGQGHKLPQAKPSVELVPTGSVVENNGKVKASGEHTSQPHTDTTHTYDNKSGAQTLLSTDSHQTYLKNDPSPQSHGISNTPSQRFLDKTLPPFHSSSGLPVKNVPQYYGMPSDNNIKQAPDSPLDPRGPWHTQKPHTGDSEPHTQTSTFHTQHSFNRSAQNDDTNRIHSGHLSSHEPPKQFQTEFPRSSDEPVRQNSTSGHSNQFARSPGFSFNSPSSQENQFFVPTVQQPPNPTDVPVDVSEPVYDYFAHLRSQQKVEARPRTASTGSQDDSSPANHPQILEPKLDKFDHRSVVSLFDISPQEDFLLSTKHDQISVPLSYCSNQLLASDTGDSVDDVDGLGTDDGKPISKPKPKLVRKRRTNRELSKPVKSLSVLGIPSLKPSFLKTHTPELFKNYPCRVLKTLPENTKGLQTKSPEAVILDDFMRNGDKPIIQSTIRCRRCRRKPSTQRSRNSSGTNRSRHNSASFNTFQTSPQSHSHMYPNQSTRLSAPSQRIQDRTIKEEYQQESEPDKTGANSTDGGPDMEDKNQQKNGWLPGWFGRLKWNGVKNIHLPDDSKPSIVWDDKLKQWIDVNDPSGQDSVLPPPPAMAPNLGGDMPPRAPTQPFATPPNSYGGSNVARSGARSRYVNVLANQTTGPSVNKLNILQPPLPQTFNPVTNLDISCQSL